MNPPKIDRNDLLRRVRAKARPDRVNYTLRLNAELLSAFKKQCEKEKVTPTAVVEEFLEAFIKQ